MATEPRGTRYRTYWATWFILLVLTLGMILVSYQTLPRPAFVSLLLPAMLVKASLIGGYFMHLRFEKLALILVVVLGICFTAAALFFLIAPDGVRILELSFH